MKIIKTFESFLPDFIDTITLYHGTCEPHAEILLRDGFNPERGFTGSNMGRRGLLYLSSDPEDALWFAQEKGCNTIVKLTDVPLEYLRPDPEDEAGYTMTELLYRIKKSKSPAKFALYKYLPKEFFSLLQ